MQAFLARPKSKSISAFRVPNAMLGVRHMSPARTRRNVHDLHVYVSSKYVNMFIHATYGQKLCVLSYMVSLRHPRRKESLHFAGRRGCELRLLGCGVRAAPSFRRSYGSSRLRFPEFPPPTLTSRGRKCARRCAGEPRASGLLGSCGTKGGSGLPCVSKPATRGPAWPGAFVPGSHRSISVIITSV